MAILCSNYTRISEITKNFALFILSNDCFDRDLHQMSSHLDCAPVWLDAQGISDPPEGWPLPNQTRFTMRNEHLSYLITWYMLSAFTAVMWHRYFVRKLPLL